MGNELVRRFTPGVDADETRRSDVSIHCPYCRRFTLLSVATARIEVWDKPIDVACRWRRGLNDEWWIGVCGNSACRGAVLVHNLGEDVYPYPLPCPSHTSIPKAIRADLDEAKLCFSVHAYRGCAVMARRAIQSCCLEKGATKDKFQDQIDELWQSRIVTKELCDWAHVVRWVGNDAAHPKSAAVTQQDSEDILKLAEQLLNVVYVTPAVAKEVKRRKGKK